MFHCTAFLFRIDCSRDRSGRACVTDFIGEATSLISQSSKAKRLRMAVCFKLVSRPDNFSKAAGAQMDFDAAEEESPRKERDR